VEQTPRQYIAFRKRLDSFVDELPGLDDGDVEALHRARVASRRLREAFPLLRLNGESARKLARRLRKVTKQLGPARELDVEILLITELQQNRRYPIAALKKIRAAVLRARDKSRERLAATLPTAKMKRLADDLDRAARPFEAREADQPKAWAGTLEARLARRAAVARSAIERAGTLYVPEYLHDVRIALKKLRYTVELSKETLGRRRTADIAALKRAQDLLGRLHDLQVLMTTGREVQASLSPPDLADWREVGELLRAVEEDCRMLHARYVRERAKLVIIAERMGGSKSVVAMLSRAAG
jgi:CHAD domain-containing protein